MAKSNLAYFTNDDFSKKTDNELISYAKEGNEKALEYLFCKYKDIVNMKVNKYFIIGAEKEDIIQEGMIGLYKAVKSFETDKQNSFRSFANLCVERQLITAIKTSNRQKHIPLNSSLSLNTSVYEDDDTSLMELFNTNTAEDPLDTITKKEYYTLVGNKIDKHLSSFEKQVLSRFAARR
ncbi:MAG: sigma-70 family RNA polymerase sigma factor [Clostridia bacterium]|nr:sigma-70 family RNA polymerase sigma factor [Clostridia bacterium]